MSRQIRIEALLRDALAPLHLEISDDSAQHNVPPGDVSHLRLLLVSERFAGVKALDRHRRIHALLRDEFANGLHALSIHAWTPEEWFEKGGGPAPAAPPCQGGASSTS